MIKLISTMSCQNNAKRCYLIDITGSLIIATRTLEKGKNILELIKVKRKVMTHKEIPPPKES